jgi:hypothetical protein
VTLATWLAIAVAGPGALFVFGWFLYDVLRMRRRPPHQTERSADTTARTSSTRNGAP